MKVFLKLMLAFSVMFPTASRATVFGSVRGVVHDPDHRPVEGARVALKSDSGDYSLALATDVNGAFEAAGVPVGACLVTVTRDGFAPSAQTGGGVLGRRPGAALSARPGGGAADGGGAGSGAGGQPGTDDARRPSSAARRSQPLRGPIFSNSLNAITDFVPGAYMPTTSFICAAATR